MSAFIVIVVILILVIVGLVSYFISIYNQIQRLSVLVSEGFSTISVYLQKRYDLIPNLVECVKGYAAHEKPIFDAIANSRSLAMSATSVSDIARANSELSLVLSKLLAVSEAYPDLKANESFKELQVSLEKIETELANARKYYNGCVRNFNQAIIVFPNNLIANSMKASPKEFFEAGENAHENVKVSF